MQQIAAQNADFDKNRRRKFFRLAESENVYPSIAGGKRKHGHEEELELEFVSREYGNIADRKWLLRTL